MTEPVDRILIPDAPADTVAALGAMGQFCLVAPSRRTVIVRLGSAPRGDWTGGELPNELWQALNQSLFN
jgi:CubicO group peptidase (beta-lactamase class C family)